jgi:hypothetical protein
MSDTYDRLAVLDAAQAELAPAIGRTMAGAAVRAQCEKLGIDGGAMTAEQLGKLLDRLALGLVVFVGRGNAEAIRDRIRARLAPAAAATARGGR